MIKDPRSGGNTLHHFGEIIFVAFTCILCGVKSYELMQEFCEIRLNWFRKWITLPNGVPCDNTFARVFEAIDPELFSQCIIHHLQQTGVILTDEQIAIDGKALRGSRHGGESHIHVVSAWACAGGITLAQCFASEKSNEITAIPELLETLNLQGAVVTIDAMGTQREIATKIVEKHGDYILCVKGNRHKEISDHFEFAARQLGREKLDPANWSHAETLAKSHGRNERRQTIACHWVLDTLFREDHNQTQQKNGAKNHSTMRRIAHNTLKLAPDRSKLRWGRNKDLDDARDVLAVQGPETLDMEYIERWCAVSGTLERLKNALDGIPPLD